MATQPITPNNLTPDPFAAFGGKIDAPIAAQTLSDPFAQFGGKADASPSSSHDPFSQFGGHLDTPPSTPSTSLRGGQAPSSSASPVVPSTWDKIKNVWHVATSVPIPELVGKMFGQRGEQAAKLSEMFSPEGIGYTLADIEANKLAQSKNRVVSTIGKGSQAVSNFEQGAIRSSESPVGLVASLTGTKEAQEAVPAAQAASKVINTIFGLQGVANVAEPRKQGETDAQYAARIGGGIAQTGIALLAHHAPLTESTPDSLVVDSEPAKTQAEAAQTIRQPEAVASARHAELQTSASKLGPEFNEGERQHLISTYKAILNNPSATSEEKDIANSQLADLTKSEQNVPPSEGRTGAAEPVPVARIVTPDYVPVVSKDDLLAETTQRIIDNSHELDVNPSDIETPADVNRALTLQAAHLAQNLDPRVAATIALPAQRELANDLGMSLDELLSRRSGMAFNAEQAIASRSLLKASANDAVRLAQIARVTESDADLDALRTSLARHQEIQNQVAGVRAEAGRALGSFRAPEIETKLAGALAGLKPDALRKAARLLGDIDPNDSRALNSFIQEITPSTTADKIFEVYRNALLSSPKTAILKGVSENLMLALNVATKAAKGGIGSLRGDPDALASDSYWYSRGVARALPKALKYGMTGKFDLREMPDFERTGQQANKGWFGKLVRFPQNVLSRQTNSMYILNYYGELESQAAHVAASEGLNGEELAARQAYLTNNPTDAMREAAHEAALHGTFQQELGKTGRNFQQALQSPIAKYVFPFFKTPINLIKTAGEFSPYGLAKGTLRGDAELQARGLVGSSILAGIAHLVAEGHITGGGPLQYNQKETLEDTGWQPYSIKVGGHYTSYHRAEPVGLLMGVVADAIHAMSMNPNDPETARANVTTALNYILRNVDDLPFMSSLSDLMSTVDMHGNMDNRIDNFLDREIAGFVPAAVSNVAQIADRTIRRPTNLEQTIENKIPGLRQNVPPVLDAEGHPAKAPASSVGGINPFPVSEAKNDPVITELARLGIPTPSLQTHLTFHGQKIELTPQQSTELYRKERADLTTKLATFLSSPAYRAMSDDDKRKEIAKLTKAENTLQTRATIGQILNSKGAGR